MAPSWVSHGSRFLPHLIATSSRPIVCHMQPATFEFYDPQSPIYTSPRVLPPATVRNCKISDAIIAQVR